MVLLESIVRGHFAEYGVMMMILIMMIIIIISFVFSVFCTDARLCNSPPF